MHLNCREVCTHAICKTSRTQESFSHQGTKMLLLSDALQGIIQSSCSWTVPYFMIFFRSFIQIQKIVFKQEYLSINNCHLLNKVPFYSSKGPFMFFQMLPYDSRLFPGLSLITNNSKRFVNKITCSVYILMLQL